MNGSSKKKKETKPKIKDFEEGEMMFALTKRFCGDFVCALNNNNNNK